MDSKLPIDITADHGPKLIAICWTEAAIAITVLGVRIWGRLIIRKLGADDFMMVFAVVLFIILSGFITYLASIGGWRHLASLSLAEQRLVVKYNWIAQPWVIFGFAVGKISVALLTLRIIGPNTIWRKWILWGTMVSVFLINTLGCILTFVQCDPPRALWTPQLIATGQAKCWDPKRQSSYAMFLSSWNVMIDVLLAILPMTIVYQLHMSLKRKVLLCCLLGTGLLAAICGAIKVKFLAGLNARSDLTWETYNLFMWSASELFVIIVCGSIPPIKPVFDLVRGKSKRAGYTESRDTGPKNSSPYYAKSSGQGSMGSDTINIVEEGRERVDAHEYHMKYNGARGIIKMTDIEVRHHS